MSSGYFPLEFQNAVELKLCVSKIRHIKNVQHDLACQDLNGEDASADGIYLGYLSLAAELIERCYKP